MSLYLQIVIFLTIAISVFAFGWAIHEIVFRYRAEVSKRILDRFGGGEPVERDSGIFRDRREPFVGAGSRREMRRATESWIRRSGVATTPLRLAATSAALVASLWIPLVFLVGSFAYAAPIALAAAPAPWLFVEFRRRDRLAKLQRQLPDAFDAMARAVRAGHTAPSALRIVADEFEGPLGEEFECCYGQQDLGMSPEGAWKGLAARTGVMEMRLFVMGMLVQSRSGGNLVELLENLAQISRTRLRMQMKVRSLTGEGRMQAAALTALPLAAFGAIFFLAPDYAKTLLDQEWLIAITACAQIAGMLWIRRILQLEY